MNSAASTEPTAEAAAGEANPVSVAPSSAVSPSAARDYDLAEARQSVDTRRWNFWGMAFYQVILRVGWIFKTESIIMPAVLDSLGCGPAVRAWLPLFNRLGQSVPPLLAAHRVRAASQKKVLLACCSAAMALSFLSLSALWWWTDGQGGWLPYVFLAIYALFFVSTGVHQLCFGALQGKLIPVRRRGRLLMAANIIGAASACLMAAWLLPQWLSSTGGSFEIIFCFTGVCFLIAAGLGLSLREYRDDYGAPTSSLRKILSEARDVWRRDANVRRLAVVGSLFGVSVVLFPHYQALARERLNLGFQNMMLWVVVQNAGTAMFSFFVGPLADRRGNRLVMVCVMLLICISPLMAIGFSYMGAWGATLYPLVFVMVGLTPNVIRTFHNYTLEISEPKDHARFLSTISLFIAAPALLSPLVGKIIEQIGLDAVFIAGSGLLFCGWLLCRRLLEPRDG